MGYIIAEMVMVTEVDSFQGDCRWRKIGDALKILALQFVTNVGIMLDRSFCLRT